MNKVDPWRQEEPAKNADSVLKSFRELANILCEKSVERYQDA